jgi:hypothetical protein
MFRSQADMLLRAAVWNNLRAIPGVCRWQEVPSCRGLYLHLSCSLSYVGNCSENLRLIHYSHNKKRSVLLSRLYGEQIKSIRLCFILRTNYLLEDYASN